MNEWRPPLRVVPRRRPRRHIDGRALATWLASFAYMTAIWGVVLWLALRAISD